MDTTSNTKHFKRHPFSPNTDSDRIALATEVKIQRLKQTHTLTVKELDMKRKAKVNTYALYKKQKHLEEKITKLVEKVNKLWEG